MNEVINVLICDDDEISLGINQKYVELYSEKYGKKVNFYCFQDISEELEKVASSGKIDLAILDITLTKGSGIEIAKKLQKRRPDIPIIFVTSHEEYKSLAYDILVIGYLVKPILQEKFAILFKRALAQIEAEKNKESEKFIEIYVDKKFLQLRLSSIISAEKLLRKVKIKSNSGIYEISSTLSDFKEKLNDDFIQISQSVIVNKNEIKELNSYQVSLFTGDEFTIGRTYAKQVRKEYQKRLET